MAKLFELAGMGTGQGGVCLRPELTAGIVRAYTGAPAPPILPWRVSHSGVVFRYETPRPDRLREFRQVGVERLGDSGPHADGEPGPGSPTGRLAEAGVKGRHDPPGPRRIDPWRCSAASGLPALASFGPDRDARRSR